MVFAPGKYFFNSAIILLISFVYSFKAEAIEPQKKFSEYVHNEWKSENGLPQNTVHTLLQTRDGYIWIGTEEGLARFDGNSFTVFDSKNYNGLKYNEINSIYEDYNRNLWIGTEGGGLSVFKNGSFKSFFRKDKVAPSMVELITGNIDGSVWFLTNDGIYYFKGEIFKKLEIDKKYPESTFTSLSADSYGRIWIGTSRGFLLSYNKGRFTEYNLTHSQKKLAIYYTYEVSNHTLWVSTSMGIFVFDKKIKNFIPAGQGVRKIIATSIYEDKERTIWLSTEKGLVRVIGNKVDYYTSKQGLSDDEVYCTMEDNEGSLWIGTGRGGLNRLEDGICYTVDKKDGLVSNEIYPVYQSSDKSIWVGSSEGISVINNNKINNFTTKNGLTTNYITSFCQDKNRVMWIGTNGKGVETYKDGRFFSNFSKSDFQGKYIFSMCQGNDSSLWLGSVDNGFYHYINGKFIHYNSSNGLPSNYVISLATGLNNELWIGTLDAGLVLFKNGKFTDYSAEKGLKSNVIFSIYQEKNGVLWIGTGGGGLVRFKNNKFTSFNTSNGLFDNKVFEILDDGIGNLWMSSNKGIYRAVKKELNAFADGKSLSYTCISYGTEDGMKNSECNGGVQPAGTKTADGKLIFPSMKGIVVVEPSLLKKEQVKPPVYIENILINNKTFGTDSGLAVPVGDGKIEINFTALSYLQPQKVKFKYKLVGFDKEWVSVSNRRFAYYTNLPYGDYTFKVIACNNEGIWNEKGASFSFYLEPPFTQTVLFYSLCIVLFLGFIYSGYRYWLFRLIKQKNELEKKVAERTASLVKEKEKLEMTELQFRSVTESANDAIVCVDIEGKIFIWNKSAEILFGFSKLESLGMSFANLFEDGKLNKISNSTADFLFANAGRTVEIKGVDKSRNIYPLEVSISKWGSNTEIFFTAIIRDITERKQAEEALRASEAKLKDMILKKDKFFSVMSHDLRSPFSSLLGFSEYLASDAENFTFEEIKNFASNIHKSAGGILRLLENLLQWSRLQSNVIEFDPEIFDLTHLIEQILDIYHTNFIHKNLHLEKSFAEDIKVFADRNMIDAVIRNLISNAIKFTGEKGSIKISTLKNSHNVEIIVEDNGQGIKSENISKLFKVDENYSTEGTQKEKGTGLGLILCKEFISKNNGEIWVESEWGKGSKFHFTLNIN